MSSSPPLNGPPAGATTIALPQAIQRAFAACQRGELREAEQLCRRVLEVQPKYFDALYLLAIIEGQSGNAQQAVDLLSRALAANPGSADAYFNRGVALGELRRYEEAVASYDRAIALRADYADAHYNRGIALGELDRHAEALESYAHAIELRHDFAEAYNNHGFALSRLGRQAEAVKSYERAIALRPQYASACNNLANALADLERRADALASFERAIALRPDYAEAYNNRGIVLNDLERRIEALASFDRAISLKADYAEAFYNRGNALRDMHRHREAVDSYRAAISIRPHYASAHWNLADCYLMLGEFALGWQEYEWRWKLPDLESAWRVPQPVWLGDKPVDSRTVLLHSERGLGDTLLFCRYAKEVADLGAKVILEVQPPLLRLLAGLEGVAEIMATGDPLPAFDYHCPLMSLPLVFRTDLNNVPASVPYVHSDCASVAKWLATLGRKTRPRVGVVWSGSMLLRSDKRSMPLAEMLPLARGWAEWVSLQKEVNEADASLLASRPEIRHFGGELKDFADTAALVDLMDVVVTVDTSVANLAGAMGKAVWVMLPFNPHDWRWMLDRDDSIWYPTARLFRQPAEHDWASVIRSVDEALAREFAIGG